MNDDDQIPLFTVDPIASTLAGDETEVEKALTAHRDMAVSNDEAPDSASAAASESVEPSGITQDVREIPPGSAGGRWFYVTNRLNLVSSLSARLIGPRSSLVKYYADLLEDVPGWIPLVNVRPTKTLLERVTAEPGGGSAVIVELPSDLPGLVLDEGGVVAFVPAVALADVVKIHFPDEKSLRQHRARPFGNVHAHDDLLVVSPELFESTEELSPSFAAPPDPKVDWRSIDRLRGGVSGAVAAASTGEMLAAAAGVLGAAVTSSDGLPTWLPWTNWSSLTTQLQGESSGDLDERVFRAAYSILSASDASDAWSPRSVLRELRDHLGPDANDIAVGAGLTEAEEVMSVERPFEAFRYGSDALRSLRAVLLVLLRPSLIDLIEWPPQESGADEVTRVLAAVLAGSLRGLSREAIEVRSLALDDVTARWAVTLALGDKEASLQPMELREVGKAVELVVSGVAVKATPARREPLLGTYLAVDEVERGAIRVRVARALGWPVTTTVRVVGEFSIEQDGEQLLVTTESVPKLSESVDEGTFLKRLGYVESWRHEEAVGLLRA